MITLAWICNRVRRFKPFVSSRIGEIQTHTDPCQWKHVPGDQNVADDATRGISVKGLNGRWMNGPQFLYMPEEDWPEAIAVADETEVSKECRKVQAVFQLQNIAVMLQQAIDCKRFSKWRRLIRMTAWIIRSVDNLKAKVITGRAESQSNVKIRNDCLTPDELQEAELLWIKDAQKEIQVRALNGEFKMLSPFKDENGVIRVEGRVDKALVSYETRHPILLPNKHWISYLITRHMHQYGHCGIAAMAAKTKQNFWILRAHDLAKRIKFQCVFCREMELKAETQVMADLPRLRLTPYTTPFYNTSCDYFGPYNVKIGRNKSTKHYGVIFTCLNTRAVHLELAVDYSTMEYIQLLRRFFAIRGYPHEMLSDNGSQLVGAEKELQLMIKGWNIQQLKDFCADRGMKWRFTTPAAPHQNGCSEDLAKGCKFAIVDQVLTPFELYTCLLEVANLMNQRPIGRIPDDPDDGCYLCPNDMLLGRASSEVPQGPSREMKNPRHRVEFVQRIVDSFWKHWNRDLFPLLVPRKKWNTERRNVRVDDIVTVADPNAVRGKWTIGRVMSIYPGSDGKIRNVKVKTSTSEYQMPITKIVVICPAEGYEE